MSSNNENGFFTPICAVHTFGFNTPYYSEQWRIPQGSVNSVSQSVQNWLDKSPDATNYRHIDLGKWPDNKPCAGQTSILNVRKIQN